MASMLLQVRLAPALHLMCNLIILQGHLIFIKAIGDLTIDPLRKVVFFCTCLSDKHTPSPLALSS